MPSGICVIVALAAVWCAHAAPLMRNRYVGQATSVSSKGEVIEVQDTDSRLMRSKAHSISALSNGDLITNHEDADHKAESSSNLALSDDEDVSGKQEEESVHMESYGRRRWDSRRRGDSRRRRQRRRHRRRSEPSMALLRNFLRTDFANCPNAEHDYTGEYNALCTSCDWLESTCIAQNNLTSECVKANACQNQDETVGGWICDDWDKCIVSRGLSQGGWTSCNHHNGPGNGRQNWVSSKSETRGTCAVHCASFAFGVLESDDDCGCYTSNPCTGGGSGQLWSNPQAQASGSWVLIKSNHYCFDFKLLAESGVTVPQCQALVLADSECGNQMFGNGEYCGCVRVGEVCNFRSSSYQNNVYELQASGRSSLLQRAESSQHSVADSADSQLEGSLRKKDAADC